MRSKHERAFELAKAVTQDFPRSVIGWATWINSAPASIPFGDVESTVPNEVQRDADVALALADRAALAGRHADAESYARKALEDCPKHPFVLASLGGYILRAIVETGQKSLGVRVSPKDVPRVREAIDCLTRAIDLLLPSASRESLSRILRNRAAGHRMLGETALGERDIVQAHEKSPAAPEIAIGYAYLLASRNQMGSAIASLPAACATNPMLEAKITLASLLDEQGTPQGREEAIRLLRSYDPHAEGIDPAWSPEYFALLFLLLSHVGRDSEANEALEHARRIGVPDPYLDTARAAAARERGNKAQAAQLLSGAFKDRAALTHVAHKAVLAKELQRAGLYREAFTAWHELVPPTAFGPYTLNLLHCGERAGEDSQLLDFCRTLRENGFYERPCIELEAHILFKYAEYDRAVEVFREGISHATEATDQRVLRLRLSALGVHLKRRELVEQDAELLPQSGEIAPGDSPAAVVVLRNGPDPAKAARFAYAVLRKHFDDEHAHAAMIMSLIGPFGPEVSLPDCPVAQTGCGVDYEEIDIPGQEPQFFILEDEESPNSERRELPAGHPTAKQLIGKRVNDEFLLFPGAVQERRARVKEIVPKLVVRFRDCLSGWQRRFPHRFFIQQVSMPKRADGQLDFAPMFRILDEQEKVAKTVEQLYRDKLVPVHVFAESLGRTVFESVLHVAGTEDLQLRCCAGTEAECSTALDILAQGPETVVDLTALATVFALEAFALLEHTDGLVVVQSTLDPEQA